VSTPANLLNFSHGNAKLSDSIMIFSLPTGHSCPGAEACLCKAARDSGKLTDGSKATFRCYAAAQEAAFGTLRQMRWRNFDKLRKIAGSVGAMHTLIARSINEARTRKTRHVRIHGAGDFFSSKYYEAWMRVTATFPDLEFYAYTKSLPFWTAWLDAHQTLPSNLNLVASRGGKFDDLIDKYVLPEVVVVMHPDEAAAWGLEIDDDDTHAQQAVPKFALLIHGQQKAGSDAAAAKKHLDATGIHYGYGKKKLTPSPTHATTVNL
jgi:hypothetical protein